jgi:FAD/FMN-containing dehydrogenase
MLRLATLAGLASLAASAAASPLAKRAALHDCLAAASVPYDEPGTEDYKVDSAVFNVRMPFTPAAIAVPQTEKHIQDAVACGVKHGVKVTPKCGGHSYSNIGFGGEDGHLMLQLDRMNKVTIDGDGIATVPGGSRLGHVASVLYTTAGRAFSHGTCPG